MELEKLQLGDVIKSSAIGKSFKELDLILTFQEHYIELQFKDALGLEIRKIPYTNQEEQAIMQKKKKIK